MALTCPNINMPEWQTLQAAVGKMEAYRDYMETDGLIRTPEIVKRKLEIRQTSLNYQLTDSSVVGEPIGKELVSKLLDVFRDKFDMAINTQMVHEEGQSWKGYVYESDGVPTIVINTAHATLDTPLHEFGHIFISMIKSNIRTYSKLMNDVHSKITPNRSGQISDPQAKMEYDRIVRLYKDKFQKQLQLDSDDIAMFDQNKDYHKELKAIKSDPAGRDLTKEEWEDLKDLDDISDEMSQLDQMLIEELLVELLGQYAAGHLNKETGLYEVITKFWNAIVDIIKSALSEAGVVDVLKIDPKIELEQLANLLVNPEITFTTGTKVKDLKEKTLKAKETVLNYKEQALDRMQQYNESNSDPLQILRLGELAFIVTPQMKEYIKSLMSTTLMVPSKILNIRSYLKNGDFSTDTEKVYNDILKNTSEPTAFMAKLETKYAKWFALLPLAYDNGKIASIKELIASYAASAPGDLTPMQLVKEANMIKKDVIESDGGKMFISNTAPSTRTMDHELQLDTDDKRVNHILGKLLSNTVPGLQRLFGDKKALYYDVASHAVTDADIWFEQIDRGNTRLRNQIEDIRNYTFTKGKEEMFFNPETGKIEDVDSRFLVQYSIEDTVTGRVEIDELEVSFRLAGNSIDDVSFHSKIWGYGDTYFFDEITSEADMTAGKTEFALKNSYFTKDAYGDQKFYSGQGMYVGPGSLPGKVVIASTDRHGLNTLNNEDGRREDIPLRKLSEEQVAEHYAKLGNPNFEFIKDKPIKYYEVSLSNIVSLRSQNRVMSLMPQIIGGIAEMTAGLEYKVIRFSPAFGSSIAGDKAMGKKRDRMYKIFGQRLFSTYHNDLEVEYRTTWADETKFWRDPDTGLKSGYTEHAVLIPQNFRKGLVIDRALYQKTDPVETRLPFTNELEESVIGQAIINDVTENVVEPVLSDQTEAISLATRLSDMLDVSYQTVTSTEAAALTANQPNPWSGEKAFFIGDTVYFVGDHLTTKDVFHEFAHPFIRHIAGTNPTLFSKLYKQLSETAEGQAIIAEVAELYPDLDSLENMDLFKEEVIVKALTAIGLDKLNKFKTESRFSKVINNILYAIKQALRKMFGKVPVSGLNTNTTLEELADMLVKGGKFEVDKTIISESDIVAYNKERTEYIDDLINIDDKTVQSILNKQFDIASNHINQLLTNRNYDALADLLTDEDKRGDLQELKSNLQAYQTTVTNMASRTVKDMEYMRNRSTALVNSMFRLKTVMSKILEHAQDLKAHGESQENLHKANYYEHLIDHWQNFIDEAVDALNEQDLDEESPVFTLLDQIKRSTTKTKKIINEMYAVGARDGLYNELAPTQQHIKEKYDKIIQELKDKGAPQKKIDRYYKQYHGVTEAEHERLKALRRMSESGIMSKTEEAEMTNLQAKADKGVAITPEKIEKILKGGMGDANFFNSYLEGYLYNTDPVIGGLATYVKNNLNEVMVKAQGTYNRFSKELQPLLEDAGFNPNKPGDLGEQLGFLDTVAKREDDGTITPRKVWTFLNPFRDYRHDYDVHKDKVEKAQQEYHRTGTKEAERDMTNAVVAKQKFMRKYFHQEYVPEFYERDALFEKDDIGKAALLKRKQWGDDYRALTEPANTPEQQLEITGAVDLMWREWRQMSSMYYMDGSPKRNADGTPNEDGQIALRIKEYNEVSRPFYETKPRKGVFQNALRTYEQKLRDEGNDPDEFKRKRAIWIKQNVVRVPKQTWHDRTQALYARQKEILKKLDPEMRKAMDEQLIMDQIFDLQGGFKDEYGQTKAVELSEESRARVIAFEKDLQEMRASAVARNGLTPDQNARLSLLHEIRKAGSMELEDGTTQVWNQRLQKEMSALHELKDTMGLTKFERDELDDIRVELTGISKREATSYYVDIMNTWLADPNITIPINGIPLVNKVTADEILEPSVIDGLLGQDAKFDEWFYSSHLQRDKWNNETKQMEKVWTRSTVWSQTIPIDPSQYETFEVKDEAGNVEVIQGKPIHKYFSRVVKQEFRKEKIVGVTVDNKYKWLPKSREEGSRYEDWDSKYINEEYEEMRANDPKKFKALEKMKEWHLKNQEGISSKGRLYYDYPRYRKENLELVQSENLLTNLVQRVKGWFHGLKDDAEQGFNDQDQWNLVRMDIFDNDITSVPIHGLYDIDHQDVSTDVTLTMMQYMLSGERQKQLVKISPMARAVQSVVSADANKIDKEDSKGFKFINKFNFFNNNVVSFGKQKGDSVRKKTIDNFIEREFEGKRMTGAGSDVPWLNNTASLLFKRASFGFFAFNIPSALKNSYGAKFQGLIEASAGEHMTHLSFQKGNIWSYGTMGELSFGGQLYKKGPMSLRQQLVQIFDPSQDRFEDTFGEGLSRTLAKDAAGMTWLYNFRKWVELQATIQIFGGMMYHQTVTQEIDGVKKEIPYMEAWELRDDMIQLKEGIDPEWGITYDEDGNMKMGKKFSRYKNTVHQVMNNLQGAYAKFDQPEAQRYLVFRFLSYLRRYFTTMTLNRFGFSGRWGDPQPRLNPGLGDVQMGYYIEFVHTLKETITGLGRNLMYLTGDEKKAAFKVMTELGALFATTIAMSLLFGWDPDDDERFEKLRDRSGALPFPMTSEDPDRPFNGWGFMENHMLYLLMNVRSENEQFLPFPGYGLDDYSAMLDLKSIAFGPTVQTYKEIFEDSLDIMKGSESAYYKRDVGPYTYQQEGGAKIWAHIGRTLGLTGSALDPAKGIKGFQSVQARARR